MGTGELVDAASLEWEAELRDLLLQKRFSFKKGSALQNLQASSFPQPLKVFATLPKSLSFF